MKNFYIQTIVLLFVVLAGFTSKTNAQFASSNEVYCYQYLKTVEDGVTSYFPNSEKKTSGGKHYSYDEELYFVIFQGEYMRYFACEDLAKYRSKCLSEPDYYSFANIKRFMDKCIAEPGNGQVYKYNAAASTSSKYSYCLFELNYRQWNPHFLTVYSFSLDKSELIIWHPNKGARYYYKRINVNSLKPNLDFLD